jgi:tetratricopeptide (TPR) repeat protein
MATACGPALAAEDRPDLADGFYLLKVKDYAGALEVFNQAARENPDFVDAHFGRAQALEALNRRVESVKEFQLCLLLKPSAAQKAFCDKELDYMTLKPPAVALSPTFTLQDVERTSTTITNQAAERITALQRQSRAFDRRSSLTSPFPFPTTFPYPSSTPYPSFSRYPRSRWSGYDMARSEDARRRSNAFRECAEGLKSEMATKPSDYTGIHLSPQNTNLYVRNYIDFDPVKSTVVDPIMATPLSYKDAKKNPKQNK